MSFRYHYARANTTGHAIASATFSPGLYLAQNICCLVASVAGAALGVTPSSARLQPSRATSMAKGCPVALLWQAGSRLGVDRMRAEDDAVEIDQLNLDVLLGHSEVEEAVHGACMAPRGRLGRDAAASTRDETSHASQVAGVVEDHLRVRVAGDEQVQAELLMELLVPVCVVPTGEVRDGNLPIGGGCLEP
eukprot:CAMPEP_0179127532 /NCGR_PEP_ID=MMETSP0796-20121207/60418_1 /TAXON_ID=73915 /ORGANISM="Pyrodinium bahamense, Strain pbaha01" /LENGTH=190 /DNA_ID=CAMNT_0020826325 /DNA_START=39 /DNA_END=609 /DNA_ORIENTATION=-